MAAYRATIDWVLKDGEDFANGRYSRGHTVSFEAHVVPATASRHVVGKWAVAGAVDPEEMLVASLSNCHMLTFLHVARLKGFVITRYRDAAEGVMEKNAEGRMAVTRVTLRPEITYAGRRPTDAERDHLHHEAHEECFIANSVKTEVVVEEVVGA
ncbi:MAG: OsmC family protein [Alphaproteobacteria bacterium]|nr:OsmC family protein [Alphaproteobacteria bacterium]MBU1517098.1 OsmC family protein [Alphaproteobacteria bacterium]MBU2093717.1 OsmC family protein [Alphaproteobacteria bacterium]MBU2153961.1 OsmC family protein [Alphaproteobacteria bacterium]MBU2308683.1 OsmC family protein [Alphaproteobacteria bacterium]